MLDPDRAKKLKVNGGSKSFGGCDHFCAGWQLALSETRMFLDSLLRVPEVRLDHEPDIHRVPPMLQSYEFRNAIIERNRS
jgi:cytochrome P450